MIIIGIGLIVFFSNIALRSYYHSKAEKDYESEEIMAQAQYIATALELIEELENKGITIDSDYQKYIKNKGLEIIDCYNNSDLDVKKIGELLYIDQKCNSGKSMELLKLLNTYYVKDKKIFAQFPYNKYNKMTEKENEELWVYYTIMIANQLCSNKELICQYNLEEGLADWYNNHIKLKNKKDYMDNLVSIFWYLYEINRLDLIDASTIQAVIENDVMKEKEILDNGEEKESITLVLYADEVSAYQQLFYNDDSYVGMTDKIFYNIDSFEQLEYDKDDETFIIFLLQTIKTVEQPGKNEFFFSRVNDCLKENCDVCFLGEQ